MYKTINEQAIKALSEQNWKLAQTLFFNNAHQYPCHETFNNLGFFLAIALRKPLACFKLNPAIL